MSLQSQVDSDIKDAMRTKSAPKLGVLRMLKSALMNAAIEKAGAGSQLDDTECTAVIRREVKKHRDSVEGYKKGGRLDLVEKEEKEIEVLRAYLPKALSQDEVTALVKNAIFEAQASSKSQMGMVMRIATAKAAGRADGKTLSAEVQRQLS